jgi:single-stranded DNA-binding protein
MEGGMSLHVLCSGTLHADPVWRTTAAGKAYATCRMRVPCEDADSLLVSVVAFSKPAVEALLAHGRGDAIAVTGRAGIKAWTGKDGQERHGLSIVADACCLLHGEPEAPSSVAMMSVKAARRKPRRIAFCFEGRQHRRRG